MSAELTAATDLLTNVCSLLSSILTSENVKIEKCRSVIMIIMQLMYLWA